MKKLIPIILLLPFVAFGGEFSTQKAKKVDNYLKKISLKRKRSVIMKSVSFTEAELNSYLNIIYSRRYAPEVKYIKLNLRKDNFVSGNMKVLLKGEKYSKLPSFLKDFEIDFEGKIECNRYRMRYNFEKIKINGTTFAPEILDEAFFASQTNFKIKKSIFDWFRLLPGIKNIKTANKKITIYY
ncbi:MAG: hypothetical protein ABFR75_13430 [Acidobacteriota bacterium]